MKKLLASLILISSTLPVVAKACDDILLKSSAGLFGTKSFAQDCDFQNRYAQVKSIFSKYSYDETILQFLRPPFEYFAIDLIVTFIMRGDCLPEININPKTC